MVAPTFPAGWPLVKPDDDGIRPAGPPDACFYCHERVGHYHARDCVIVKKRVRVRFTYEIEIEEPHAWTPEQTAFHFNEGSWCANNGIANIQHFGEKLEGCFCLDDRFTAEFVAVVDEGPISRTHDEQNAEDGIEDDADA